MINKSDFMFFFSLQIAQTLYLPYIDKVPLFRGCSSEFINQIVSLSIWTVKLETFSSGNSKRYTLVSLQVIRLHEDFFLPGEVIMEQGSVVDQLYFVCHGVLVNKIPRFSSINA